MASRLLRSMPFLADILLKIYRTIGKNWERAGNVRYAVVCRPGGDGMERGSASERAGAIAAEWSEAMRDSQSGVVRDFVAVGDVSVKVIGADGRCSTRPCPCASCSSSSWPKRPAAVPARPELVEHGAHERPAGRSSDK